MKYTAKYWHNQSDTPGAITIDASYDDDAISQAKEFVESGYRNETGLSMTLSNGSSYWLYSKHGKACRPRACLKLNAAWEEV